MLLPGDEISRTQHGNNNAYCHDSELSWVDWEHIDHDLLEFTKYLIELRRKHPIFRRRRWFEGTSIRGTNLTDIGWFRPSGEQMSDQDWKVHYARGLGVFLNGYGIKSPNHRGGRILDDSFYLMWNAHHEPLDFTVPPSIELGPWFTIIDTTAWLPKEERPYIGGDTIRVEGRSMQLLVTELVGGRQSTTPSESAREREVSRSIRLPRRSRG
jgi:isoamylase